MALPTRLLLFALPSCSSSFSNVKPSNLFFLLRCHSPFSLPAPHRPIVMLHWHWIAPGSGQYSSARFFPPLPLWALSQSLAFVSDHPGSRLKAQGWSLGPSSGLFPENPLPWGYGKNKKSHRLHHCIQAVNVSCTMHSPKYLSTRPDCPYLLLTKGLNQRKRDVSCWALWDQAIPW